MEPSSLRAPYFRASGGTDCSSRLGLLGLIFLLALALPTPRALAAGTHAVAIIDDDFQPATLSIALGDAVTWTNTGVRIHNVVAVDGLWTSPRLSNDGAFSRTFDTPGAFSYRCTIHPWMAGVVEVAATPPVPVAVAPPTSISVPASVASAQTRRYSPSFVVDGEVGTAYTFTLDDLRLLPLEEVAVEFMASGQPRRTSYRGVRLYDLINLGSPRIAEPRARNVLRYAVLVTATDGYQAIVSWGEFDPTLEAKPILVAFEENGQLLGEEDGMARLVVPGDGRGGRYVSNIVSLTLVRLGEP